MRPIATVGVKSESGVTQTLLKELTDKKIAYLLSKHTIKDVDVYTVIKEFFKEYLHANYEFTFDELTEELKKVYIEKTVKDSLFRLLKDFSTIEYKDEEIPQEVLREILSTFSKLVDSLIKKGEQGGNGGLFSRLFGSKDDKQPPASKDLPGLTPSEEQEVRKEALPEELPPLEKTPAIDDDAPAPPSQEASPGASTTTAEQFEVPSIEQPATDEPTEQPAPPSQEEPAVANKGKAPEWVNDEQEGTAPVVSGEREPAAVSPADEHSSTGDDWTSDRDDLPVRTASEDDVFPFEQSDAAPSPSEPSQPENPPVTEQGPGPQQEPAPAPPEHHEAAAPTPSEPSRQQPSTTRYFGDEDKVLSDDLNRLAEQLDHVIKDEDLQASPTPSEPSQQQAPGPQEAIAAVERLIAQGELQGAQDAYRNLLDSYNRLPEDEKHRYYGKLQELYTTLQNTPAV